MSRGIEIHNGEIVFPEGMPQTIHLGTSASPLTQGEAGQIVISAVIDANALGGNIVASYNGVNITVAMAGNVSTIRDKATVEGVVLTGDLVGIHTEIEAIGADGEITGSFIGHKIELYSDNAGFPIGEDVFGIFVNNYNLATLGAGAYSLLRLEENGTMIVDNVLFVGVTDAKYFMALRPNTPASGGWDLTTDVATSNAKGGILRITTGVGDKAIQLYDIPPA